MIRNVVFDMGGVLLAYEPWAFVQREIADPEEVIGQLKACAESIHATDRLPS